MDDLPTLSTAHQAAGDLNARLRRGAETRWMPAAMKLSVIIPAYNEEAYLPTTLEALHQALTEWTPLVADWEVIVCDNNSTDATPRLAESAGCRVVHEPINQIGRARNTGAAAADGEWLLFVDADTRVSAELIADLHKAIGDPKILGGGCTVRLDSPLWRGRMVTWIWNQTSRSLVYMAGSFLYCETAAFREIGGFSDRFYASEEIDLTRRLKREARRQGRRLQILHRHPVLTSARKFHLYGIKDWLRFSARALTNPWRTIQSRDQCFPWYDGRR